MTQTKSSAVAAYSLFDFGNSGVSLIFHAYLFPLYFKHELFRGSAAGDFWWGLLFGASVITAAVAAPIVGRIADGHGKYSTFACLAVISFVTLGLLALSIGAPRLVVCVEFVIANAAFYLASNVYDSILVNISSRNNRDMTSGIAWGVGYLGGVVCFVIVFCVHRQTGVESSMPYLVTAAFYTVFAGMAVWYLRPHISGAVRVKRVSWAHMARALDRGRVGLLLGYWLVADTVTTVIFFTAIYASDTLALSTDRIGMLLLLTQLLAFPGTILMARLARAIGAMKVLCVCILIWLAIIGAFVAQVDGKWLVGVAIATSTVIGTTQALMRAQYSQHVVESRSSELFGWYAIATESSSIVAPVLFGICSAAFGQRLAMGSLALPLCVGTALIAANHARVRTVAPVE